MNESRKTVMKHRNTVLSGFADIFENKNISDGHTIFYKKLNILYTIIPKNGNTSLQASFQNNKVNPYAITTAVHDSRYKYKISPLLLKKISNINIQDEDKRNKTLSNIILHICNLTNKLCSCFFKDTKIRFKEVKSVTYNIPCQTENIEIYKKINNFVLNYNLSNIKSCLVLRNPFKRIISGYIGKIVAHQDDKIKNDYIHNILLTLHNACPEYCKEREIPNDEINFRDFVQYLTVCTDFELDRHFRSQTSFITLKNYTEIFDLETLNEEWKNSIFKKITLRTSMYNTTTIKKDVISGYPYNENLINITSSQLNNIMKETNSTPSYEMFFLDKNIYSKIENRFESDIILYKKMFDKSTLLK